MEDLKPNSHRFKEEQKRQPPEEKKEIQKVVKGPVKVKKKSAVSKAVDQFVEEDLGNIKTYLISDVIIPTIKNTIWDAITNTLDMVLFGGTGRAKKNGPSSSRVSYVSYNNYSNRRDNRVNSDEPRRSKYDFSVITFNNKSDADEVLRQMDAIMDTYKMVSVSDFYDLIGESCDYTDQKYGWMNLRNARTVRGRDGYYLELPKPIPID